MRNLTLLAVAATFLGATSGCGPFFAQAQVPGAPGAPGGAPAGTAGGTAAGAAGLPAPSSFRAAAGVPLPAADDPTFGEVRTLADNTRFGRRSDPFALLDEERRYEQEQENARLSAELGGFGVFFEPEEEAPDEQEITEPQPFRRLAGVILSDGVVALIEMENGRVYEIRPGMRIPDSEWTVLSISAEQAVLVREGNRLPRRIIVRLQGRPEGSGAPAGQPGGMPGGAPGGGPGGGAGGPGQVDI